MSLVDDVGHRLLKDPQMWRCRQVDKSKTHAMEETRFLLCSPGNPSKFILFSSTY